MTTTTNPRTPQPGDVWGTGHDQFVIVQQGDLCLGEHAFSAMFAHLSEFRYLGRASDLIALGIANRTRLINPGDWPKEHPND